MKFRFSLCLLLIGFGAAQAQGVSEQSDPAAKQVLDKIRKKYEGYKTVEATFTLQIEVPGQPVEIQRGTIVQEGPRFRLEMDQQVIVCDGKSTWIYLKSNHEVQITNSDPNGGENAFLTPRDVLKRYQKGDFLYAVTDKNMENGQLLTKIEFKPRDKHSEYAKLRLTTNEKTLEIKSIKAFAKDGSRYTFSISRLLPNKNYPAGYFVFDAKKYPGIRVEDLRL
jgi:outer membrane lipoprotein-sorting protein